MNLDERLQKYLSPDIYCLVHNKIVNLEQQCQKQKKVIDKAINLIIKETKSMPTNGCKIRLIEILDILNKVSE